MRDVAVIGGGPAGIAAAIQSSRFGFDTVLIERGVAGGQLRTANLVENYPGFPGGISGSELARRMREQLLEHSIEIVAGDAEKVEKGPSVTLRGNDTPTRSLIVIVCTGAEASRLACDIPPSIQRIIDHDIDDSASWNDSDVAVVGGGEAAFDRALNLAGRGARVTILSRSQPSAMELLRHRASDAGVVVRWPFDVARVDDLENSVALVSAIGEKREFDRIVVSIGKDSSGRCALLGEHAASVKPSGFGYSTCAIPGVFLAGDLVAGRFRQAAWAAGSGLAVATAARDYLMDQERKV